MNRYFLSYVVLFIILNFSQFIYGLNNKKIVSLAPNLTEIVYALGLGNNLVGNTVLCDYPEEAKKKFKIGNYNYPNIEKIIASGANVVLATDGNPFDKLMILKSYGIEVFQVKIRSIYDLPNEIKKISILLNAEKNGITLAENIEKSLKLLAKKNYNKSYLFILQFNPIYSLSENTWIGEIFSISGLKNIIKKNIINYPVVSEEFLMKNKPDMIFINVNEENNKEIILSLYREKLRSIYGNNLNKINLILIPKDIMVRPGPRIIEGINFIERL